MVKKAKNQNSKKKICRSKNTSEWSPGVLKGLKIALKVENMPRINDFKPYLKKVKKREKPKKCQKSPKNKQKTALGGGLRVLLIPGRLRRS